MCACLYAQARIEMLALLVKFRGEQLVKAKMNELLEIPQNTKKYFVNAVI